MRSPRDGDPEGAPEAGIRKDPQKRGSERIPRSGDPHGWGGLLNGGRAQGRGEAGRRSAVVRLYGGRQA
jgi:hypothetical protein